MALGAMMVGIGVKLVYDTGLPLVLIGVAGIISVMGLWFRDVISESRGGLYDAQMDRSFRWGMGWFIFRKSCFSQGFSVRCFTYVCLLFPG
ncbi:hypothetical protein HSBAA_35500 [Vreelandella sulfidaeris]|uniref:Heme-copper oxidase subunit III family profile domain-containing protein n=1 Tax=Vreelandella sulfidaeris TaxID=115553 RepID=A0A455UH19_9GAMM|nr:hypothetical protein HSBAA_35500 [Halomonas sulfidaeris]